MNLIDCHCDNLNNCIHRRHLRVQTPPIKSNLSDQNAEHLNYSPTSPAYSPLSPAYASENKNKDHLNVSVNRKRQVVDVIDLTNNEVVVKKCEIVAKKRKVTEKANQVADVDKFECPITQCFMTDPVIDILGHTYERSALQEWLKKKMTSPMTRQDYRSILIKRKMASKRDSKKLLREKIVVGKNYSMIHDKSWIILNNKKKK